MMSISIIQATPSVVANAAANFVLDCYDWDNCGTHVLDAAFISEATESDAQIEQPACALPNYPPGTGNLTVPSGGHTYLPFRVVFNSPNGAGPSPQQAGGSAPDAHAQEADAVFTLGATCQYHGATLPGSQTFDVVTAQRQVTVLSAQPPAPSQGGAFTMAYGANLATLLAVHGV